MSNRFEGNIYVIDSGSNAINNGKPLKVYGIAFNGTGTTCLFQLKQGTGGVFLTLGFDSATKVLNNYLSYDGVWFSHLSSGTLTDGTGFLITG